MKRTQILSAIVALSVLMATGWLTVQWWPVDSDNTREITGEAVVAHASEPASSLVRLSDAKTMAAKIQTQPVTRTSMVVTRTLPARFAYDDRRHVAVRAPTDAIIETVHVTPGDEVQAGDVIAVLRSPAIGEARGLVLQRQAELEIATRNQKWQSDICDGVKTLAADIRDGKAIDTIESDVVDATLGKYRGELLAAYSQSKLATQLSGSASSSAGAISGRVIRERQSRQQQARAGLEALIEQSLFETQQACKTASAKADAARRSLMVARQQLATALGVSGDKAALQTVSPGNQDLARLEIRSPLSGTVELRKFSATERVTAGAEMFIIADTSALWVEADIRGRDWRATNIRQGDRVSVMASNEPDQRYDGSVYYVGRQVDVASGAVSLVIEIDNNGQRFRPGLFARVEVPIETIEDTIAVPTPAVIDLDGQPSVFVRRDSGFAPIAVDVGVESSGLIQIDSGLSESDQVVTAGAFVLKSEMLLEGEE